MVLIEYYGPSRKFTNDKQSESIDVSSIDELFVYLQNQYSVEFVNFIKNHCGIALNLDYVKIVEPGELNNGGLEGDEEDDEDTVRILRTHTLDTNDEIAIIPPVSSG